MPLDEGEFAGMLADLICEHGEGVAGVKTFAAAGLLTTDTGLVVATDDGSQFEITVVRR